MLRREEAEDLSFFQCKAPALWTFVHATGEGARAPVCVDQGIEFRRIGLGAGKGCSSRFHLQQLAVIGILHENPSVIGDPAEVVYVPARASKLRHGL